MNKIGVSIIIPCYNTGRLLIEAVESILIQPFRYHFEIIIIDDGSTDKETINIINGLEKSDTIVVSRANRNRGAQFARNVGLKLARFDYIFTLDSDDCLNAEAKVLAGGTYSDLAIDILRSSPDVAFVHGMTLMFGDYAGLTISAYPVTESLILEKHHAQNSIVYRKQDAIDAGFYDEAIKKWQDWSFAVAILNTRFLSGKSNNIFFLNQPYYLYRIHSHGQRISSRMINEKEMIHRTFLKHPEIFRHYYNNLTDEDIINTILSNKPDRLKDLLYIAADNLDRALDIALRREFEITTNNKVKNIP